MTPEPVSQFRTRLRGDARRLMRAAVLGGPVEARARNGNAQALPTSAALAANFALRADWEASARPGVSLTSRILPTRLGAEMFRVESVCFRGPDALAAFLGEGWPAWWAAAERVLTAFPALRAEAPVAALLGLRAEDVTALGAVCAWRDGLSRDEAGTLLLREAKAEGVGTKWIETHARAATAAFDALGWGAPEGRGLAERLGFLNPDASQVWARLAPEDAEACRVWERFSVPSGSFTRLPFAPREAVIIENEATFLKFPVEPGRIVLWGGGKAVVATAPRMTWLSDVPRTLYWGDVDGAGYLILDRLRKTLPRAGSLMMGAEVIEAFRGMAVEEAETEAVRARMPRLTENEAEARGRAHRERLRIEQERLPMEAAVTAAIEMFAREDLWK